MIELATSKQLSNLRNRFRRAAATIERKAAAQAGPERELLRTEARRLQHLADQSLVGRGGTTEERSRRINAAYSQLSINAPSIKTARGKITKPGLERLTQRRLRQERIFSASQTLKARGSLGKVQGKLFMMSTRDLWSGASNPAERYGLISARSGGRSISEVYSRWVDDLMREHSDLVNAIHDRDWTTLSEMGWTDSEINDAKERLRTDDDYEEAKLIGEYTGMRVTAGYNM